MFNQPYYQSPYLKTEIIHVNGENGAMALQMMPNSQALLLDDTAPIVWLAQTDGAGYKTVTPYDISPHKAKEPVGVKDLEERIERLERMMKDGEPYSAKSGDEQYEAND